MLKLIDQRIRNQPDPLVELFLKRRPVRVEEGEGLAHPAYFELELLLLELQRRQVPQETLQRVPLCLQLGFRQLDLRHERSARPLAASVSCCCELRLAGSPIFGLGLGVTRRCRESRHPTRQARDVSSDLLVLRPEFLEEV